ncbi:MAG: YdcH family protein [Rhodobacteraceae bacterium]|nr:YdcH family protein [Paracoccaceae bacterium]
MPDVSRLEALKSKHAELESMISEEERRPSPDYALVHELKRKKLQIKDQLQKVSIH